MLILKKLNFCTKLNFDLLGNKYLKNRQYRMAKDLFNNQIQQNLDNNKKFDVWNKIAYCNKKLGNYNESEIIYNNLFNESKISNNKELIEKSFLLLFRHCIKYNIEKALELSDNNLDFDYSELFKIKYEINKGITYLLDCQIVKSKKYLFNHISKDLSNELNGITLNNFAIACWWHKHPNYLDFDPDFEEEVEDENEFTANIKESKDQDFNFVIPVFKNSIFFFEKDVNPENLNKILEFLNIEKSTSVDFFYYKEKDLFKNPYSGIVLLNLAEFILSNHKELFQDGYFFLINALKILEKNNLHGMFERGLVILSKIYEGEKQYNLSEKLFEKSIEINKMNKSWNKTPLIFSLKNYGKLLEKIPEKNLKGKKYLSLSYNLEDEQEFWHKKLVHLIIPN